MTTIPRSPKQGKTRKRRTTAAELDPACLAKFAALTADEPTPPKDGSCAVCGKPRRPERSARYAHGCAEIDPFCSTECAREFHHNPISDISIVGLGYTVEHVKMWNNISGAERKRRERARARERADAA